ncbi:MAG: 4-hydroxy-tetrahydrodipicolinate reductase, partial [Phaeodactylibacter sp.]|nr:4-hydroxy-tetrahydrodipicolinate reductase [Phaeodactylibacter sp.]
AVSNIAAALEAGVPVVSGTTGWLDRLEEVKTICAREKGAFFYASNFSIGVNIFFALNRYLARMMDQQPQYDVELEEIHHTQKLDAPSGTAITLAQGILDEITRKKSWINEKSEDPEALSIISKRIDPAPGTHEINYHSEIDSITIRHTAHSREGFAAGALMAAEWIVGRQGVFGMSDMLPF